MTRPTTEGESSPPAVSAPAPVVTNHTVTDLRQEVNLQVQSVENLGSMLELHPSCLDRNYKYRWVNTDPKKIMRAKARGYEFVRAADHKKVVNVVGDPPDINAQGLYIVGDVILMRSKKALYRQRRTRLHEKTEAKLGTGKKEFKGLAARLGKKRGERIKVSDRERQRNEPRGRK